MIGWLGKTLSVIGCSSDAFKENHGWSRAMGDRIMNYCRHADFVDQNAMTQTDVADLDMIQLWRLYNVAYCADRYGFTHDVQDMTMVFVM